MRAALVAVALLLAAGCSDDTVYVAPDLSSSTLYCPPTPPVDDSYECDATAIPYCTYPTEQVTCRCMMVDGKNVLVCPHDMAVPLDSGAGDGGSGTD